MVRVFTDHLWAPFRFVRTRTEAEAFCIIHYSYSLFFAFLSKNLIIRKKLSIIDTLLSANGQYLSICFTKVGGFDKIANKVSIVWTNLI
jgi:hypothetical protein